MINSEITKYVEDERLRGVLDEDIKKALLVKGWKVEDVNNAFTVQRVMTHTQGLFIGRLDKGNFLKIVLIGFVLQFVLSALFGGSVAMGLMQGYGMLGIGIIGFFVMSIIGLIIAIYEIGATVRRLHDLGQTGWYALALVLVSFIPVLGLIVGIGALIYLSITPGNISENSYGAVPNANISLVQAITGSK